jgi:hypothetical protein
MLVERREDIGMVSGQEDVVEKHAEPTSQLDP